MKRTITAAFLLGLLLASGQRALAEELRLTYDVRITQSDEKSGGKKEEKEFRHKILVGLGNGYFYFTDPSGAKVYDLEKKRILYVDDPGKTFSDVSLYSDIGFRFLEFRNRLFVRDVVLKSAEKAKGPRPPAENIFDLETLFGVESPGAKTSGITEAGSGGKIVYGSGQGVSVECRLSDQPMTEDRRTVWEKYLVYGCRIHPQIRKKLATLGRVPEFLRYTYRDGARTVTVEQTLVRSGLEPRHSYEIPSGYQRLYGPPGEALNAFLTEIWEGKASAKRLSKDDFEKTVSELAAKGALFDAALGALESSLQSGEELSPGMKAVVDNARAKDDRTKAFFENLAPKDKPAAERSAKILSKIKRKGLTRGHVIDLMIADDKAIAGDFKGARDLFFKVLKTNPFLAGAYKDLGDLLNRNYYVVSAWQCWDTVRFLSPRHKMLQQVNEYESWLRKTFPEFFLPEQPVPDAPSSGSK